MVQRAGRITCPKCGANNFDTVTSCWKCGTPVGTGAAAMAAAPLPMATAPNYAERAPQPSQPVAYAPSAPIVAPAEESRVARNAAIWLGLTLPWIGLPVGWIFMMIEDRRKQAVGRICVWCSVISLVLNLVVMLWFTWQTYNLVKVLPTILSGYLKGSQGGGGGMEGTGGMSLPRGYSEP